MKRHPALIPLSRDHHDGLVQAVRLRRAAADGDASARLAAAGEFVEFFRNEERVHLRDEEEELRRVFSVDDFAQALEFTKKVGELAEDEGHHPALLTEWGRTTVTWWTHKIKGLHRNDFIMAAKTDELDRP